MKLTFVNNCMAWGHIVGRNEEFPWLPQFDSANYECRLKPGDLVSCYYRHMASKSSVNRPFPVGTVVQVGPHPNARGDVRQWVLVLWNHDDPPVDDELQELMSAK